MPSIVFRSSKNRTLAIFLVAILSALGATLTVSSSVYAAHPEPCLGGERSVLSEPAATKCWTQAELDAKVHDDIGNVVAPAVDAVVGTVGGATAGLGLRVILAPIAVIAWLVFKIGSLLLGIGGVLFNYAIGILVFGFAKYLGNSPGMLVGWGVLRDFGNIGLLFGFVFMGISTILDLHSYPWKKALPALVIFAVLLNFSLFAAEAVVDSANVLAATLYSSAYQDRPDCNIVGSDALNCFIDTGVAGQILAKINITSVYGQDFGENLLKFGEGVVSFLGDPLPTVLQFVALALVVTIAAVVLFAGAFMIISRAIVLAFLMVTSPIGFAGMAIPPLHGLAEQWWKKLIDQALFAPVFLLLLLVALKMTDGLNQIVRPGEGIASAITATSGINMGPLLIFGLMIGFMVGALIMAKQFGIYGADFAVNSASGLVFGSTARVTNAIVGGTAYGMRRAILQSPTLRRNGVARGLSTLVLRPATRANFDARRAPGVAGILGAAGASSGTKPAEHASFNDLQHIWDENVRQTARRKREAEHEKDIQIETLETEAHGGRLGPESVDFLNSLSEEEITQLHAIRSSARTLAQNLNPDMFAKLMTNKDLDAQTKNELMEGHYAELMTAVGARDHETVRRMAPEDLATLAKHDTQGRFRALIAATRANGDDLISEDQHEALIKNKALNPSQRDYMREQSIVGRVEAAVAAGNIAAAQNLATVMKPKRKAKLDRDALVELAPIFDDRDLAAIAAADKIDSAADRQRIRNSLNLTGPNGPALIRYLDPNSNGGRYWG